MTQNQTLPPLSQFTQETRRQQTVARLLNAQSFAAIHWRYLAQDGTFVQLRIGRCRFTTRFSLEEDMGVQIDDPEVREKLARWVTQGEKRLLPENYMRSLSRIESRARETRKEHAFHTELGYFVPVTAYENWRTQTEALQTEYMALRDEIIANHPDLVRQVLAEYEIIAADTYQRLRATNPELVREGQQQFVAMYCNRIADQIPTPARIRDSFSFRFFRVESTRQLGASSPSAEAVSTEREQQESQQVDERARARAMLTQDVRQDAQQRVNAMLDDFLTSIVARLRALTYDAATDVLATIQRRGGERFSGRSTMQLNNLLTQIRSLNFFGDSEIEQMMARVQSIVAQSPAERQRSMGSIEQTLRAIATTTRATLLDLGEDTRAARPDLGIAAFPTAQLVSSARAELRLPPVDLARVAALAPTTRSARAELTGPADGSLWQFAEHAGAARSTRTL